MSDEKATPDLSYLQSYLEGEEVAFREVESWVRREIAVRYPLLSHEMEDLCQAIHMKLLENLRSGRFRGHSSLRTYVVGITHHTAIDRIRQLYRERTHLPGWDVSGGGASENPYRSLAALQDRQMLHHAVQRAPAACRELWRMVFLEQLSYVEIGRRLSIPPGTVKSRMWYCRRKVLSLIEQLKNRRGRGAGPEPRR